MRKITWKEKSIYKQEKLSRKPREVSLPFAFFIKENRLAIKG